VILSHVVLGNNELEQRGHVDIDVPTATITLTPHSDTEVKRLYPEAVFYVTTSEKEKVKGIDADAWLFADQQSRDLPYLTVHTASVRTFSLVFTGSVLHAKEAEQRCHTYQSQAVAWEPDQQAGWAFWQATGRRFHLACNADNPLAAKLNDLFYWYLHNAMVHYTIPHGLEQYTGAAWGVRDVCQGPVEMLFATRHYAAIKAILLKVFAQQYEDSADWPQWFMFDRFVRIQHPESHGDIIVWPLKALALYLEATNDGSIFDAEVPYTEKNGFAFTPHQATLFQHVQRTIDAIEARFIPGTALSCYGSGDWDDTLQPADAAMRQHMVSAWTVALTYQVFQQLATALQRAGYAHEQARLHHLAQRLKEDFNQYLINNTFAI
jgi:cellobiose phosphorylase